MNRGHCRIGNLGAQGFPNQRGSRMVLARVTPLAISEIKPGSSCVVPGLLPRGLAGAVLQ